VLPINDAIVGASTELPALHRDPCDRFLIATAQLNDLTLATPDSRIRQYPHLRTLW
jgi:PIN domain nuclease of toxin-antitoxin system